MQQKYILNPFAEAGDKTAIPDTLDPSGYVSYPQGFGFDYERNNNGSDPLAKNIERQKMNELFFDITSNIQQYQQNGAPEFITSANNGGTAYSYNIDAKVRYDDSGTGANWRVYRSKANTNTALPTDTTKWELAEYAAKAPQYTGILNANLSSAATVNIGAATGDYIHITGTTTITAFDTIAAGIERTLVFDGALTLTHNATSLILPTGANITTAAGDTARFKSEGSGNWRCVSYNKKDGTPIVKNVSEISASVATNALTVGLNPTNLNFRNTTLTNGTMASVQNASALSLTVPSGATLGTTNATAARLVLLAINNSGTMELAIVNLAGGNNLDETTLINTTAISGSSNSANVIYSTAARTGVAFRVVGFIDITESTAGTWATAPTLVQGQGGESLTSLSAIGSGQTWQDVTASRAVGTTYYNTTGRPISLYVVSANTGWSVTINGTLLISAANGVSVVAMIIPAGNSYALGNGTLGKWLELR